MPRLARTLLSVGIAAFASALRADKPVWAGGNGGNGNAANWVSSTGSNTTLTANDIAHIDNGKVVFNSTISISAVELTTKTSKNTTCAIDGNVTLTVTGSGLTGSTWDAGEITFSLGGSLAVDTSASLAISG